MALLQILRYPDPRLRNRALPVANVDGEVNRLVADMFETMYAAPGVGLAAVQVNVARQVIVIDVSEQRNQPLCLINPKILAAEGEQETQEGCLSVPDIYEPVRRPSWVRAEALNRDGEPYEVETEGLLAVCIQHEIDHLNGKLFIDRLSQLKRQRIRKRAHKQQREMMM